MRLNYMHLVVKPKLKYLPYFLLFCTISNAQELSLKEAHDFMLIKNGDLKASHYEVIAMEEEKKAIADDIRDKFAEAKAVGFDVKALRQILRLRKKSKDDRDEEEAILATYMHALGMSSTELDETAFPGC